MSLTTDAASPSLYIVHVFLRGAILNWHHAPKGRRTALQPLNGAGGIRPPLDDDDVNYIGDTKLHHQDGSVPSRGHDVWWMLRHFLRRLQRNAGYSKMMEESFALTWGTFLEENIGKPTVHLK